MSALPREIDASTYRRMSARALASGSTPRLRGKWPQITWDLAGRSSSRCGNPGERQFIGIAPGRHVRPKPKTERNPREVIGSVTILLRCRKCLGCARAKAQHWSARCRVEANRANRVWFWTGTCNPLKLHAIHRDARRAYPDGHWEVLSHKKKSQVICGFLNREVTLYLKRLRKRGHSLRYLFVTELHASGEPHVHALIFEQGAPITEKVLRYEWRRHVGYMTTTLVSDHRLAAGYVSKYVSKATQTRMRASIKFGRSENE